MKRRAFLCAPKSSEVPEKMKNILWFINRLSKMTPAEVVYRFKHKLLGKYDKIIYKNRRLIAPHVDVPLAPLFALSSSAELSGCSLWDELWSDDIIELAGQYLDNSIDIFGVRYEFGQKIEWHQDPKTKKKWPVNFWTRVDIRDGITYGGAKFVWEVNRLYALPILGLAYKTTQKKEYAEKYFSLLTEWQESNPYPYGVNWTSGIELSVRVANAIWGLSFLQGYEIDDSQLKTVTSFVYSHAYHLYRYPSKYSSNNNHAIAEAFGLFVVGVYFPDFSQSEWWQAFGQTVLERECLRQILPDGGSYECSSTYLSFVYDFFLLFKIICDRQGIPYDDRISKRLEQSCEFISVLRDSGGNMPNIGDQDSAVLVNFGLSNDENFKSILNTGAVLFGRDEFFQNDFVDLKTFLLTGQYAGSARNELGDKPALAHLFDQSGLAVVRRKVCNKSVVFVGIATPLGMPPLYAHGHLDALSFTLSIEGKPFLVDPGTYLYHSGGKWRRYFRSTSAHNTIMINDTELTEMPGDFMFGKPYSITEHSLVENNDGQVWQAAHDAYQQLDCHLGHKRKVLLADERIVIEDFLSGQGSYSFRQFFHFHPDCNVEFDGNKIVVENGGVCLEILCQRDRQLQLYYGCEDPLSGWFSRAFNQLEKTHTVVLAGIGKDNFCLKTDLRIKA